MILKELRIDSWVGDVTNCYIVQDEKSKETMVIDPAGDVDKIVEMLDILNANLKYWRSKRIKRKKRWKNIST